MQSITRRLKDSGYCIFTVRQKAKPFGFRRYCRSMLLLEPSAQHAELPTLDERHHGHGQRGILRNFRQEIGLGGQTRHQLAAVPHQKEVNAITVIVDGVEQSQQAALHAPKLHGLGEDENCVSSLLFSLHRPFVQKYIEFFWHNTFDEMLC